MCGIIGYVSNKIIKQKLINSLLDLQYRGYDSSGIALVYKNDINLYKCVGNVENLIDVIPGNEDSNIGIGHTRWATHGKVSIENTHPHISNNNRFCLVHNGTIDNYETIKKNYLKNFSFYSETDTEVLVNYFEYMIENFSLLEILHSLDKSIKGTLTLIIVDKNNYHKLFFYKRSTPLICARGNNGYSLCSDTIALDNDYDYYTLLDDNTYGYIDDDNIKLYKNGLEVKKINWLPLKEKFEDLNLSNHKHYMIKEIHDQIALINNQLNKYFVNKSIFINQQIIKDIVSSDKIYFIACGSSYYASLIGKKYFKDFLNKDVEVLLASEAINDFPYLTKNPYFIFISQSGETLDVINCAKITKEKDFHSLSITNTKDSSLTFLTSNSLYLYAGKEISVASTKSFLGQCLIFLLLSNSLNRKNKLFNQLHLLKEEIKNILSSQDNIVKIVKEIINYPKVFYLGRGLDYYISLEGALKLKEITYINSEGFASGELKHGSIATIDEHAAIICLNSNEKTNALLRINLQECLVRKARCFIISSKSISNKKDDIIIKDISPYISPLIELVYVQLFAYYYALFTNKDIDKPRNLAKSVTVD